MKAKLDYGRIEYDGPLANYPSSTEGARSSTLSPYEQDLSLKEAL